MRQFLMVLAVFSAVIVGGWLFAQQRRSGALNVHDAAQWPFDLAELRSLMSNVVAEQQERVASIGDSAGRDRAQAFLDYYERRRQAAS